MCDECVPVELPPTFWEFLAAIAEDFCLAINGASPASPERMALHATMHHYAASIPDPRALALVTAEYIDRIERRCGFGDYAQWGRRPIPNMVRTVGSGMN